jgi:hypothetical protein
MCIHAAEISQEFDLYSLFFTLSIGILTQDFSIAQGLSFSAKATMRYDGKRFLRRSR